jgi:hypothetical protein
LPETLHKAVLDACDASDGLVDGIVSRYAACPTAFDRRIRFLRDLHERAGRNPAVRPAVDDI